MSKRAGCFSKNMCLVLASMAPSKKDDKGSPGGHKGAAFLRGLNWKRMGKLKRGKAGSGESTKTWLQRDLATT